MQKYSKIIASIWQNSRYKSFSDISRLLYLYFVTSPHGNAAGLYYIPRGYILSDLGWSNYKINKSIDELREGGYINWYPTYEIVLINKYLKMQPILNENMLSAVLSGIKKISTISEKILLDFIDDIIKSGMAEHRYYPELIESIHSFKNEKFDTINKRDTIIIKSGTNIPAVQKQDCAIEEQSMKDNDPDPILDFILADIRSEEGDRNRAVFDSKKDGIDYPEADEFTDISLILADGSKYRIMSSFLEELSKKYYSIDVEQELIKMSLWCERNPNKRKTRRGVSNFINNWLDSAHIKKIVQSKQNISPIQPSSDVMEVFIAWKEMSHYDGVLNYERQNLIEMALKNYNKEQLIQAIKGCGMSSFHQGDNDSHMLYNDLKYIIQTPEKIEKFIALFKRGQSNRSSHVSEYIRGKMRANSGLRQIDISNPVPEQIAVSSQVFVSDDEAASTAEFIRLQTRSQK